MQEYTIGKTKRRVGEKRNVGKSEKRNVVKIKTKRSEILTRDAKINTKKRSITNEAMLPFLCVDPTNNRRSRKSYQEQLRGARGRQTWDYLAHPQCGSISNTESQSTRRDL